MLGDVRLRRTQVVILTVIIVVLITTFMCVITRSQTSSTGSQSEPVIGAADNDWFWNGSNLYANPLAQHVGIGTTNPQYRLHVNGSAKIEGSLILSNTSIYGAEAVYGPGNLSRIVLGIGSVEIVGTLRISGIPQENYSYVLVYNPSTGSVGYANISMLYPSTNQSSGWLWNDGYLYTNAERVGIGTPNPQYKLDVNGDIRANASSIYADYIRITEGGRDTGWYLDYFPGGRVSLVANGTEIISALPNGYVGIGTTNPQYRLDVLGDIRALNHTVYAEYIALTEGGKPSGLGFDYYPSVDNGFAIGMFYGNNMSQPVVFLGTDSNGQPFVKLVNWQNHAWARISRWTNRLEIASSDAIEFRVGGYGDSGTRVAWIDLGGVHSDYFRLTEGGNDTPWYLDYFPYSDRNPLNGYMGIVYNGSPILTINPSGWVNITGWLKIQPPGIALTKPPSGWAMGVWTWDVYAEGSLGVGRNGNLVVWISGTGDGQGFVWLNNTNNGAWARISRWTNRLEIASSDAIEFSIGGYGNNGAKVARIDLGGLLVNGDIRANASSVYADYFTFTENGNPTGFAWDYFPSVVNGRNAIGVAVNGVGKMFIDDSGYVYAPRFYVTDEGSETTPQWYIDYNSSTEFQFVEPVNYAGSNTSSVGIANALCFYYSGTKRVCISAATATNNSGMYITYLLAVPEVYANNVYANHYYSGDIILKNGWRITELGSDGIAIVDSSGKIVFKVTKNGVSFVRNASSEEGEALSFGAITLMLLTVIVSNVITFIVGRYFHRRG